MGGAPIPWYLAGGVPKANVLGAWCPKKAGSYAASKISLRSDAACIGGDTGIALLRAELFARVDQSNYRKKR